MRIASILIFVAVATCACRTINNSNADTSAQRLSNCAAMKSPASNNSKSVEIITNSGELIKVVGFGRAGRNTSINLAYDIAMECTLDMLRDVMAIERIDESSIRVTLNGGRTIQLNTSYIRKSDGRKVNQSPYLPGLWTLIVEREPGKLGYYSHDFDPFSQVQKLTITNAVPEKDYSKALSELIESDKASAAKSAEAEKARINEAQKLRQAKQDAELRIRRDNAKYMLSRRSSIGKRICMNGDIKYSYDTGSRVFNRLVLQDISEPGQLVAYLEGFSEDGYRIQFRVAGWATDRGKLKIAPTDTPTIDGITTQPGVVAWSDVSNWFLCGE